MVEVVVVEEVAVMMIAVPVVVLALRVGEPPAS